MSRAARPMARTAPAAAAAASPQLQPASEVAARAPALCQPRPWLFHLPQCLMGGPSAGFATCISGDVPLPGEAASGSGTKRDREEEIAAAGGCCREAANNCCKGPRSSADAAAAGRLVGAGAVVHIRLGCRSLAILPPAHGCCQPWPFASPNRASLFFGSMRRR